MQEVKEYITQSDSINCPNLFSCFYTPIFNKIALEIPAPEKQDYIRNWKAEINSYTTNELQTNEIQLVKECIGEALWNWYSQEGNKDKKFTMETIRTIFEISA